MNAITNEDLDQARAQADEAADQLTQLETQAASQSWDVNPAEANEITHATVRKRQAVLKLTQMIEQRAKQDKAHEAHSAAEKRAQPTLAKLHDDLTASHARVAAVYAAANDVLQELAQTAAAHDLLVRQTADELVGLGLPLVDEHGVQYEVGGGKAGARLNGITWGRLDSVHLFLRVIWRAADAEYGSRQVHILNRLKWLAAESERVLARRQDGLLDLIEPKPDPDPLTNPSHSAG